MLKSPLTLSLCVAGIALAPARAQAMMSCTDADMAKMQAHVEAMTDPTKREAMLKEMRMAEVRMAAKDERSCMTHMKNMESMTSKLQPTTRADHGLRQSPGGRVLPPCYPRLGGAAYTS